MKGNLPGPSRRITDAIKKMSKDPQEKIKFKGCGEVKEG
jgi:hypothetical protein